jgi:hypothetical protein
VAIGVRYIKRARRNGYGAQRIVKRDPGSKRNRNRQRIPNRYANIYLVFVDLCDCLPQRP